MQSNARILGDELRVHALEPSHVAEKVHAIARKNVLRQGSLSCAE